jgi:glycerate 2-kinase
MSSQLREHALSIFEAGVRAVTPQRLFADKVKIEANVLTIDDQVTIDLSQYSRLVVVGAGKAAAGMAKELYRQQLSRISLPIIGWINAPQGSFRDGDAGPNIHLHAARPAGMNEPTEAAVAGTRQILKLVSKCTTRDLVLVLLSGGGSALLVAPPEGITLQDKQAVAQLIAGAGGNIEQLNSVRRALSEVKGGGLARACRAGRMVSIIISDVLDDSLQTIASGPTLVFANRKASEALVALEQLSLSDEPRLQNICNYLRRTSAGIASNAHRNSLPSVEHVILANNATAVDAAGTRAVELGYRYLMQSARTSEGDVGALARHLSGAIEQLLGQREVDCLISGGEPTVRLPHPSQRGIGGRNQQLALSIMESLRELGWPSGGGGLSRPFVFLSGGTDGEDGPTTAAGAMFDAETLSKAIAADISIADHIARADAYSFFKRVGGLIETGPTNTNVCDLRICLAQVN